MSSFSGGGAGNPFECIRTGVLDTGQLLAVLRHVKPDCRGHDTQIQTHEKTSRPFPDREVSTMIVDFYFNGFPAASCMVVKISHNIQRPKTPKTPSIRPPISSNVAPFKIGIPKKMQQKIPVSASRIPLTVLPI